MSFEILLLALLCAAGSALAAYGGALWLVMAPVRGSGLGGGSNAAADDCEARFDFRNGELVATSQAAREFMEMSGNDRRSGATVLNDLARSFPDLRAAFLRVGRDGPETLMSFDRARSIRLDIVDGTTRITVSTAETDIVTMDRGSHASLSNELKTLRAMGDRLAYPAWRQTPDGTVVWANRAYLDLVDRVAEIDSAIWPPPAIFAGLPLGDGDHDSARIVLNDRDGQSMWFDCTIRKLDGDAFITASAADALLRAERTLAEFTQTFSKTFAHLTVGIAVFGKDGDLIMFNPALADLTRLPIDLLLDQPRLGVFLDALRARQMVPEPQGRIGWRAWSGSVEAAARNGSYSDLWHLPGDRTYRISGRPQVDGAFALLIEDISAEISLTRRFRDEIETGHAVLDALPDAVAVFDRAGHLVQTNAAYDTLWDGNDSVPMTPVTADDAVRNWDLASLAGPVWSDVRSHLTHQLPAAGWSAEIQLLDGRAMSLSIASLTAGKRLVRFTPITLAPRSRLVPLQAQQRLDNLLKA